MKTIVKIMASCAALTAAGAAFPQHAVHSGSGAKSAPPSSYTGQQDRAIKALSAQETQDLLAGNGMGLSRAAELNSHPGPAHVLELQQALRLTQEQEEASTRLMTTHKNEVRRLGEQLVQAEQELDVGFARRSIDAPQLSALVRRIGQLQSAIRESHLQTHLTQTALLSPEQIAQYNVLRGYSAGTTSGRRP
ncbi:MAG: periplasmic heavy metal sensor [Burkholderiaceae bacterium]